MMPQPTKAEARVIEARCLVASRKKVLVIRKPIKERKLIKEKAHSRWILFGAGVEELYRASLADFPKSCWIAAAISV